MILKRPYAFFIKNFKIFHFIIFILASMLAYRTSLIFSFMKEYSKENITVIGKNLTSQLFSPWLYILIVLLIIINIVIIMVMTRKEKPIMYYIINIILYVLVLVLYIISNKVISDLQSMVVAAKTTLAIRDILNIARLLQIISAFFYLIRATGFDIKKFDFVKDLQSLDISEEDSEEIEVAVEFEKNEITRELKRYLRNVKYYYKENKFIINIIIALSLSLLSLLVLVNANKYNRSYSENEYFNAGTLTLGVKETSIITKDYKNQRIVPNEYALVAVKISASSKTSEKIQDSRPVLVVNKKQYYYTKSYKEKLIDLGNTYDDEELDTELTDYILTYRIPVEEINSNMIFRFIDNMEYKREKTIINSIDVKIKPKKIEEQEKTKNTYELTNEIDMNSTKLSGYKLAINSFDIKEKFENSYKSCITKSECYTFKEILIPSVTRNKEKAVLKVEGNITYDKTIGKITNLYEFIEKYGTIEYTYNGKEYIETNDFSEIKPTKTSTKGTYYIEVNKDILNAERIKLSFNIRNNKFEYILKGEY